MSMVSHQGAELRTGGQLTVFLVRWCPSALRVAAGENADLDGFERAPCCQSSPVIGQSNRFFFLD